MARQYPKLPRPVPVGVDDAKVNAEALRETLHYLQKIPQVERIQFAGTATFPMLFNVSVTNPFFVGISGYASPDFTATRSSRGSLISIGAISGISTGDNVTFSGIVVGDRNGS